MSAKILKFPVRGPFAVRVERETNDVGWLVRTHDREYGWLHGSFNDALYDAGVIAEGYGVGVTSSAGRIPC